MPFGGREFATPKYYASSRTLESMPKLSSRLSVKAVSISLLFFLSSVGGSLLIGPAGASPNSPLALAAAPLSALEANWANANGDQFATDYSPQNVINSSNAQY